MDDIVKNCVSSLARILFEQHVDHDGATCSAVSMCLADVAEPHNSLVSKRSSGSRRASTGHDSEALKRRRSRKRTDRVFRRQLVDSLCLLCNQPGSDKWMCCVTFFCVDPSCADGFLPRFVQIAFQHFLVHWQPSHDVQLFLHSIVLPTSDPSGKPLDWSPYANAAFCKWHSSSTVGPASTASIAPMSSSKTSLNPRRTDTAKLTDGASRSSMSERPTSQRSAFASRQGSTLLLRRHLNSS